MVFHSKVHALLFLLTEKSTSLPGSSKELAEIFGGSDEEEDMDFPFSLNVEKQFPPLSLQDGRVSEFFLNSINSLSDSVPMDSGLVASLEGVAAEKVPERDGNDGGGGGGKEKGSDNGKSGGGEEGIKIASGIEGVNESDEGKGEEEEGVASAVDGNDKGSDGQDEEPTKPGVKGKEWSESNA